jgi:hypothetical protein
MSVFGLTELEISHASGYIITIPMPHRIRWRRNLANRVLPSFSK